MTHEEFLKLLKTYRRGSCTAREELVIEKWFKAISTDKKAFSNAESEQLSKRSTWERVDRYICSQPRNSKKISRWSAIAVAASLAVIVMVVFFMKQTPSAKSVLPDKPVASPDWQTITNNERVVRKVFLPDGTLISLLPGSKLGFSQFVESKKREVYLDGEAFFKVSRDAHRPFLVYTSALTTRVLGTSFFIKAYKAQEEIVVSVRTGKVSVYENRDEDLRSEPRREVILSPNQKMIYNTGEQRALRKLVENPKIILPRPTLKGNYTNAPVIELLASLEENYGIDIHYDSALLVNCTLTSDMSDEGFYEQIKIICNALGARYEVDETTVIIQTKGCNVQQP
jgi:transmembrane sensor